MSVLSIYGLAVCALVRGVAAAGQPVCFDDSSTTTDFNNGLCAGLDEIIPFTCDGTTGLLQMYKASGSNWLAIDR